MRITRHPGFDNNIRVTPLARFDKMMVHRARRQKRMNRQAALLQVSITQHDQELAVANGLLGLCAQTIQRVRQTHTFVHVQIDKCLAAVEHRRAKQLAQLRLRKYGRIDQDLLGMFRSNVEQAAFTPDVGLK